MKDIELHEVLREIRDQLDRYREEYEEESADLTLEEIAERNSMYFKLQQTAEGIGFNRIGPCTKDIAETGINSTKWIS